jgi:hypothetical protein
MPEYNEPHINEDHIKMALAAAKAISAAEGAPRQDSTLRHVGHSERAEIRANRRAAQNLLASSLIKAGFEVDKLEEILAQNRSALRRLAEKRKAEAVKNSSSVKDTLHHEVEARQKTMEHLAATHMQPDAPASTFTSKWEKLDRPLFMLADPAIVFADEHIEPGNSWAKIRLGWSDDQGFAGARLAQYSKLSFYYFWTNPRDAVVVINAAAYLVFNGHCEAKSDGGFYNWLTNHSSELTLTALLGHWGGWELEPPVTNFYQLDSEQIVHLETNASVIDEATDSAVVSGAYDVRYNSFLVPPKQAVVFEVALEITYDVTNGEIDVDFSSGDFAVMSPALWFEIVS